MTKLEELLEEFEKEVEHFELFDSLYGDYEDALPVEDQKERVRNFIRKAFRAGLQEMAGAVKLEKKKIDRSYSTDERRYPHGWNTAKARLDTLISNKLLKNEI